ncbi:MAG: PqqD family protein [Candidatus Thermoplasmatota archaeon]
MQKKNLLKMKPIRIKEFEKNCDKISIIVPKFKSKIGNGICKIFDIKPNYRLNLDEYGSFVWALCNGENDVEAIGIALKKKFGDKVEPIYERLAKFLQILETNEVIRMDI